MTFDIFLILDRLKVYLSESTPFAVTTVFYVTFAFWCALI